MYDDAWPVVAENDPILVAIEEAALDLMDDTLRALRTRTEDFPSGMTWDDAWQRIPKSESAEFASANGL